MEELKEKIEEIVDKIKSNPDFAKKFQSEPIKALEEVIGIDLPDDKINEIIDAVKAKINLDNGMEFLGKVKDFFN